MFSWHIIGWCFIIVPSFVKISKTFSELLSGHDFSTKIFKGPEFYHKNSAEAVSRLPALFHKIEVNL